MQDEEVRILRDLGLTALQAKIYLALIETGEATTKAIAKASKIARQNTYQVTEELQKLGLIEKILGKPIKFRAIPLESGVQMLLQQRSLEYKQIEEETKKLLQTAKNHKERGTVTRCSDEFIWIPDREAHKLRIEQAFRYAQRSIDTLMILKGCKLPSPNCLPPLLREAILRGVRVRQISNKPQGYDEAPLQNSVWRNNGSYEVRYLNSEPPIMFCIVDSKEVFFAVGLDPNPYNKSALWTNNPGMVAIAREYFERAWRKVEKSKKKSLYTHVVR